MTNFLIEGEIADSTFEVEILASSEEKALEAFYRLRPTRPIVKAVKE